MTPEQKIILNVTQLRFLRGTEQDLLAMGRNPTPREARGEWFEGG